MLEIIDTLQQHHYEAYIVGGAVRDSLLNIRPKDFDVATNATPEQIVRLFKRSKIIGRRFKIVHIYKRKDVIEVTTFRGSHTRKQLKRTQTDEGLLLSDNNYGSLEEDAQRRDFSANALYYNPSTNKIIDYCGGFDAIQHKTLAIIGDPETRFREDPVRMLRAVRLQAKLPMQIDNNTYQKILTLQPLLQQVPPARLFDEILKLIMNGYSHPSFLALNETNLLNELLPAAAHHFNNSSVTQALYTQALINSDKRVANHQPITPSFLLAVFLWPEVQYKLGQLVQQNQHMPAQDALSHAMHFTIEEQHATSSIPKRFQSMIREIWQLQSRLTRQHQHTKKAKTLLTHPRFRAAYDFLLLRESSGESDSNIAPWWTSFQATHADILAAAKQERAQLNQQRAKNRARRNRKR